MYVLHASVRSNDVASLSESFLGVHLILLADARRMVASVWLCWSRVESEKEKGFQVETSSPTLPCCAKPLGLLFTDARIFGRAVDEEV